MLFMSVYVMKFFIIKNLVNLLIHIEYVKYIFSVRVCDNQLLELHISSFFFFKLTKRKVIKYNVYFIENVKFIDLLQ